MSVGSYITEAVHTLSLRLAMNIPDTPADREVWIDPLLNTLNEALGGRGIIVVVGDHIHLFLRADQIRMNQDWRSLVPSTKLIWSASYIEVVNLDGTGMIEKDKSGHRRPIPEATYWFDSMPERPRPHCPSRYEHLDGEW